MKQTSLEGDDMAGDDDERAADEETTVIGDGRHAAPAWSANPDRGHEDWPAETGAGGAEDAADRDDRRRVIDGTVDPDGTGWGDNTADPDRAVNPDGTVDPDGTEAGTPGDRRAIDPPQPASGAGRQQIAVPPGPVLVAVGLGLLTKNGWIFQDINLTLRPASVAAVVGPAGTGRTSLLLALVGRMEANTGSLTVAGHSLRDRPRSVRLVTSVARAGRLTAPEPGLTVSESVAERCLIEDENVLAGRSRFEEACTALNLVVDPTTLVGRLAGEQATLLAVALACVRVSAVIILDDLDRDVSAATQQRMVDALIRLAKAMGPTIIVSTTDRVPVMEADVVLDRTPMDGAAIWELDPRSAPTELISRQLPGSVANPWAAEVPGDDATDDDADEADRGRAADGDPYPTDDPDVDRGSAGGIGGDDDAVGSDYDGRWSREHWEPSAGSDAGRSHPDPGVPDPNRPHSNDRGGDAPNAPAPTEDPR